jgi:hypothetical protein
MPYKQGVSSSSLLAPTIKATSENGYVSLGVWGLGPFNGLEVHRSFARSRPGS